MARSKNSEKVRQQQGEASGLRIRLIDYLWANSVWRRTIGISAESAIEFFVFGVLAAFCTSLVVSIYHLTGFNLPLYPTSIAVIWTGIVVELWRQKTGFLRDDRSDDHEARHLARKP